MGTLFECLRRPSSNWKPCPEDPENRSGASESLQRHAVAGKFWPASNLGRAWFWARELRTCPDPSHPEITGYFPAILLLPALCLGCLQLLSSLELVLIGAVTLHWQCCHACATCCLLANVCWPDMHIIYIYIYNIIYTYNINVYNYVSNNVHIIDIYTYTISITMNIPHINLIN